MCPSLASEEALPSFTLAEELELEGQLQEMERLLVVLRWRQQRRIETFGSEDPLVIGAALRLSRFERAIEGARHDQRRRFNQPV